MADPALPRQLAQSTLEALKKAGHIVVAGGGNEAAARELATLIEPVLARILPKIQRSPIMGEVSSTFGDEATDEIVEELVAEMREALLDSDSVEDVFAEDRVIERVIFLSLRDTLRSLEPREDDDEDEIPPISVRLDTLGYVAAAAAKGADQETLRDALDRAAEAAQSELGAFDAEARIAIFKPTDPDPERRIEIEAAIEEELSDLVDLGVVDLPSKKRSIPLPELSEAERKSLRRKLDDLTKKHLSQPLCPGSWDWGPSKRSVVLVFTPLSEPEAGAIDRMTAAFVAELGALDGLDASDEAPASKPAPKSARARVVEATDAGSREVPMRGLEALLQAVKSAKPGARPTRIDTSTGERGSEKHGAGEAGPSKPVAKSQPKAAAAKPAKKATATAAKKSVKKADP